VPSLRAVRDVHQSRSASAGGGSDDGHGSSGSDGDGDGDGDSEAGGYGGGAGGGARGSGSLSVPGSGGHRVGDGRRAVEALLSARAGTGPVLRAGPAPARPSTGDGRAQPITMALVPDDALVSPRYTSHRVGETRVLPPREARAGLSRFRVPPTVKTQLGGLWGLLDPKPL
jgi:hypothetical protein